MFIIELVYTAPLSEIDKHMKAHMTFIRKYYASGHFLVSGRKVPRDWVLAKSCGNRLGSSTS